jgi:hypothetical protein
MVGILTISPTAFSSPLDFLSNSLGARRRAAKRTGLQQPLVGPRRGWCPTHFFLFHATLGRLSLIAVANYRPGDYKYDVLHETC